MFDFLSPEIKKALSFRVYRYRFLGTYILIGFGSIILELIIYRSFLGLVYSLIAKIIGVAAGIFFAYIMNVRINFKVPKPKRQRAFFFFTSISLLSLSLNFLFYNQLINSGIHYELSRIIASGTLFLLGYLLHRRFSFKNFKKVGVAVYANGAENLKGVWERIGRYSDFIHVDIVDKTFKKDCADPALYRLETIRAYWPNSEIHCHLMSKIPLQWMETIIPHVDTIIIHTNIDDDINMVIKNIKKANKKTGICLQMNDPIDRYRTLMKKVDEVMLLCIPVAGESGQDFDISALEKISYINSLPGRSQFLLCIDGGINEHNISMIQAEKIISGSSVLNNSDPITQIMRLQTSSQYESSK
ncbi:GtrA family protein [Spirochaetota bacterium]